MPNDEKLTDEPGRLAALVRYDVLDSAGEGAFDRAGARRLLGPRGRICNDHLKE